MPCATEGLRVERLFDDPLVAALPECHALRKRRRISLGFSSPYGYMVAVLLVELDYLVRVVKSAVLRDLLPTETGHLRIKHAKHKCLSVFHFAVACQRVLSRPELVALSRADFLPGVNEDAKRRVEAVRALLGPVPKDVFMGPGTTAAQQAAAAVAVRAETAPAG